MKKIALLSLLCSAYLLAGSSSIVVHVPVIDYEPNYIQESRKVPVKNCYQVPMVRGHNDSYREKDTNSIGVDTLIGAVAGVAIGNQIGHGNGRDAAKIVGGIGGAMVANNLRDEPQRFSDRRESHMVEKCETQYTYERENVISGYKNYFDLNGQRKFIVSHKKLQEVPVTVTYSW